MSILRNALTCGLFIVAYVLPLLFPLVKPLRHRLALSRTVILEELAQSVADPIDLRKLLSGSRGLKWFDWGGFGFVFEA